MFTLQYNKTRPFVKGMTPHWIVLLNIFFKMIPLFLPFHWQCQGALVKGFIKDISASRWGNGSWKCRQKKEVLISQVLQNIGTSVQYNPSWRDTLCSGYIFSKHSIFHDLSRTLWRKSKFRDIFLPFWRIKGPRILKLTGQRSSS